MNLKHELSFRYLRKEEFLPFICVFNSFYILAMLCLIGVCAFAFFFAFLLLLLFSNIPLLVLFPNFVAVMLVSIYVLFLLCMFFKLFAFIIDNRFPLLKFIALSPLGMFPLGSFLFDNRVPLFIFCFSYLCFPALHASCSRLPP